MQRCDLAAEQQQSLRKVTQPLSWTLPIVHFKYFRKCVCKFWSDLQGQNNAAFSIRLGYSSLWESAIPQWVSGHYHHQSLFGCKNTFLASDLLRLCLSLSFFSSFFLFLLLSFSLNSFIHSCGKNIWKHS